MARGGRRVSLQEGGVFMLAGVIFADVFTQLALSRFSSPDIRSCWSSVFALTRRRSDHGTKNDQGDTLLVAHESRPRARGVAPICAHHEAGAWVDLQYFHRQRRVRPVKAANFSC